MKWRSKDLFLPQTSDDLGPSLRQGPPIEDDEEDYEDEDPPASEDIDEEEDDDDEEEETAARPREAPALCLYRLRLTTDWIDV